MTEVNHSNSTHIPRDRLGDILPPIHPGEILVEHYMKPLKITHKALAEHSGISQAMITRICKFAAKVTPEVAIRLGKTFGTTPELWMNLQQKYSLKIAKLNYKTDEVKLWPTIKMPMQFIQWAGGSTPPYRDKLFIVKYRDGRIEYDFPSDYYYSRDKTTWEHKGEGIDIIGYIVQENGPYEKGETISIEGEVDAVV